MITLKYDTKYHLWEIVDCTAGLHPYILATYKSKNEAIRNYWKYSIKTNFC